MNCPRPTEEDVEFVDDAERKLSRTSWIHYVPTAPLFRPNIFELLRTKAPITTLREFRDRLVETIELRTPYIDFEPCFSYDALCIKDATSVVHWVFNILNHDFDLYETWIKNAGKGNFDNWMNEQPLSPQIATALFIGDPRKELLRGHLDAVTSPLDDADRRFISRAALDIVFPDNTGILPNPLDIIYAKIPRDSL